MNGESAGGPVLTRRRSATGFYTEIAAHPLADDKALDSYPGSDRPELYVECKSPSTRHKAEYYVIGVTVTTIFETAWALRGLSRLMMDFVDRPDLAHRILDIPYQYHSAAAKRLVRDGRRRDLDRRRRGHAARHDDFAGPLADFPQAADGRRSSRNIKAINPQLKLAYHCDGDLRAIIPELIEIGVDILNPIQPACMDPAEIKRLYGDRLCFWGSLDEQRTLPFGAPEDVRREVRTRLETIGRGGGLILGPTHHIQLDTPLENFWAMVAAIRGDDAHRRPGRRSQRALASRGVGPGNACGLAASERRPLDE